MSKEILQRAGQVHLRLRDQERPQQLTDIVAKMLQEWKGSREDLHLFITLLETNKAKKEVEQKLDKIRLKA